MYVYEKPLKKSDLKPVQSFGAWLLCEYRLWTRCNSALLRGLGLGTGHIQYCGILQCIPIHPLFWVYALRHQWWSSCNFEVQEAIMTSLKLFLRQLFSWWKWTVSFSLATLYVLLLSIPGILNLGILYAMQVFLPPPLVRRCNGTTAGLGYWKVGLEWPYNTPPGQ